MPCPHFSVSIVQRSEGASSVSASAYQSGSRLFSEYDMQTKDYRYKQKEVLYETVLLPENAPSEFRDREKLWNSVEEKENQWNSQLARKLRIALPREVPSDQYPEMINTFCQEQFVSKGMIADIAIHDPHPPGHNPHAHLLVTMRSLDEQGHWTAKVRKEYILDDEGNRIKTEGGYWKSRKVNLNNWNDPKNCEIWRNAWEKIQNDYLERNGRSERVSLKSYERQGIEKIPTVHMGPAVAHMEEKGIRTVIGDLNRDIIHTNSLMAQIRNALASHLRWLSGLEEKRKRLLEELEKLKAPTLSELLLQYYDIRGRERETWSSMGRLKGTHADFKKIREASDFLHSHKLKTLDDLHSYVKQLDERYHSLSREVRSSQRRMNDIAAIRSAERTLEELKPVHDAFMKKNFRSAKERFRNEHVDELERYRKATGLLMKVNGSRTVDHEALDEEYRELKESNEARSSELQDVKDELRQLNAIRYYISRVLPEEAEPEKVSVFDRMTDARMQEDRKDAGTRQESDKETRKTDDKDHRREDKRGKEA